MAGDGKVSFVECARCARMEASTACLFSSHSQSSSGERGGSGGKMRRERRGGTRGEEMGGSFVVAQWKSATFGAKVRRLVGGGRTSLCGVCDSASLIQVLLSCHMSQSQ